MAINPSSISTQNGIKNVSNIPKSIVSSVNLSDMMSISSDGEAAVYEKSDQTTASSKNTYTKDTVTLSEINKQIEMKLGSLRSTVENLFNVQSVKTGEAQGLSYEQIMEKYDGKLKEFYQNLKVDDSTRLTAQQEISADGFWGVKQTSERTIEFAKALSGGDPSKIALLRNSIEEGYKAAEKAWGGELPEICKQTQEATLKGLDDWANERN
ncbi:hypothetical protein [Pelosinus sp. sgz500959]|uniref:hypothetical protein n=1 Tax=Pelosinus sp. sgz500959 TaxID=3242472 RepID=UPI00366C2766